MASNKKEKDPDKLSVQLNEAFERLEKQGDAEPPATSPSRPGSLLSFLAVIIALGALGAASYAVWVGQVASSSDEAVVVVEPDPRITTLDASLKSALSQLNDLGARLDAVTRELAGMDTAGADMLTDLQAQVDEVVAEIRANAGTSSQDWIMAEVEYLIRLGTQRLLTEGDTEGTLALFKAADQIVRDAEGIAAYDLRRALARDIAALEAVPKVDVEGIFLRLSALASQVEQLRQRQLEFKVETPQESVSEPVESGYFQRFLGLLRRGGEQLAGLVDYRAGGPRIEPILPPSEEYYLRQNLMLKLELAQLALLRGQQPLYADSLADAQSWIVERFDPADPTTTAVLTGLMELQMVNVEASVPDLSESLLEIRRLMSRFHGAGSGSVNPDE